MTDFDTDILREEEKPPLGPAREKAEGREDRNTGSATPIPDIAVRAAAGNAAFAEAVVKMEVQHEPPRETPGGVSARPHRPRERAELPPQAATRRKEPLAPEPRTRKEPSAGDPARARQRRLATVLATFTRAPEAAPFALMFEAYMGATAREITAAATALTALFLRASVEQRKAMRRVLTRALMEHRDTKLARALATLLGAIAAPATPPPPAAPAPPDPRSGGGA